MVFLGTIFICVNHTLDRCSASRVGLFGQVPDYTPALPVEMCRFGGLGVGCVSRREVGRLIVS